VVDGLAGIDLPFTGRRRAGIFGALLGIVLGLVFIGIGWWLHTQNQPFPDGVTTQAKVTGVHTAEDRDHKIGYSRVISFTTTTGQQVTFTEGATSSRRPEVGRNLTVSYLPGDPQSARILTGWHGWDWISIGVTGAGAVTALAFLGVFVVRLITLVAGIFLLVTAYRNRRRQSRLAGTAWNHPGPGGTDHTA